MCAEMHNAQGRAEPVKPEDIVPGLAEPKDADEEIREQSIDEINSIFASIGCPVTVERA